MGITKNVVFGGRPAGHMRIIRTLVGQALAYRRFRRLPAGSPKRSDIAEGFAHRLIELGPVYVKLGQILSTRPDFMPAEYVRSLEKLQDQVPAFEFPVVHHIIETELGRALSDLFAAFDERPAASASLSQVHFALLPDGTEVAVKIQRPGIRERIQSDLRTLGGLVSLTRFFNRKLFRNLNLQGAFDEFRRYTLQELDFLREGETYKRFRENFADEPAVIFPEIYEPLSTTKVLTMQRVGGLRMEAAAELFSADLRKKLSDLIVTTLLQMFVRDGFFHADLHPGNLFFSENASVAMIDVGMYGELSEEQLNRFTIYWLAIVLKQKKRAFTQLLKLADRKSDSREHAFFEYYSELLDKFYNSTIRERSLTQTYLEILIAGARFGFVFPSEMLLQAKALTTAEHIGYVFQPDFSFAEVAKPVIAEAFADRLSDDALVQRLTSSFPDWFLFGETDQAAALDRSPKGNYLLEKGAEVLSRKMDEHHWGDFTERRHGEYAVEVEMDLESTFNFVTRFAQYPLWHPVYTEDSHVIHVSGEYVFITPQALGSVFRLDEIVDGYHLLSNAVVIDFERNRRFKWRAPFSMLPRIEIGTCLEFESLGNNRTLLSEYFFFSESPLTHFFVNRKWFSEEALSHHIREELTGVKNLLETGTYGRADTEYLWENVRRPIRFVNGEAQVIETRGGGPLAVSMEHTHIPNSRSGFSGVRS